MRGLRYSLPAEQRPLCPKAVEAIANGQGSHSVFTSLHAEEERKKTLLHQLADLNDREKVVFLDAKRLLRESYSLGSEIFKHCLVGIELRLAPF
jgi:hypothetical protein